MYYRLYYVICKTDCSVYIGFRCGDTLENTTNTTFAGTKHHFMKMNEKKGHFKTICRKFKKHADDEFEIRFDPIVSEDRDKILDLMHIKHMSMGTKLLNDQVFDNSRVRCECGSNIRPADMKRHKKKFCNVRLSNSV